MIGHHSRFRHGDEEDDKVARRQTREKEELRGDGRICSCIYVRNLQSRAENGRVSTYDVDVPWGPCCRAVPMGKGTPRAGKERVVGKGEVWHESFIGPFYRFCFKLGVILGLETQSRFGRRFGDEMHGVIGERIFVGTR
jgi:hypothetical protein